MEKLETRNVWMALTAGLFVFAFLWNFHSNRLLLGTNDEGIYLDAARRMVEGQRPYADFWGYMSPGGFWNMEASFRLLGVTQRGGRLPVIASMAVLCAGVFLLVAMMATRRAALLATFLFFAFQTANPTFLTAQHRWESSALALLALLCVVRGETAGQPVWLAATGGLLAYASICTPSMVAVYLVPLAWLIASRKPRRWTWAFLLGSGAVAAGVIGVMHSGGYLDAFLDQLRWLRRKYSEANVMPYGSIIGGYRALFEDAAGLEWVTRLLVVSYVVLPAAAPVFAVCGWAFALCRRRVSPFPRSLMWLLLAGVVGLVSTALPRADVEHLAFVMALPWALSTVLVCRLFDARAQIALATYLTFGALLLAGHSWLPVIGEPKLSTPIGLVRSRLEEAPEVTRLLGKVRPGESLYVHPYRPLFYFLTQGRNPTGYSYLNPGVSDVEDEQRVLADLEKRPPKWVPFLDLAEQDFLRVFPSADPRRLRFHSIERWIRANYAPTQMKISGYVLWRTK